MYQVKVTTPWKPLGSWKSFSGLALNTQFTLSYLLQFLIFLHVLLRSIVCSLRLLFKGFIRGHQCSLLRQQCGQTSQQPGGKTTTSTQTQVDLLNSHCVSDHYGSPLQPTLHCTDTGFGIISSAGKGKNLYYYYLNKPPNLNIKLHCVTCLTHLCLDICSLFSIIFTCQKKKIPDMDLCHT